MNKLLSYAITALLLAFSQMAFAGVGDYYKLVKKSSELKDGDKIVIASKEHGVAMGVKEVTVGFRAAVKVNVDGDFLTYTDTGVEELTLVKVNKKWKLKTSTGYYLVSNNDDLTTIKEVTKASQATIKIENGYAKICLTNTSRKINFHSESNRFGCYMHNSCVNIYSKYTPSSSLKDSEISFAQSSATIDITKSSFDGVELNNPHNLPVTYSISPSGKATIDNSGKITNIPNEETTYTISAIFKGDNTYMSKTVKYTLVVKDLNAEFSQIVFDSNVDKGTSIDQFNEDEISKNGVKMHSTSASFYTSASFPDKKGFYFYMNSLTTFTSSVGDIVKIEFVSSNNGEDYNLNHFNSKNGTYNVESKDHAVWTGKAQTVIFEAKKRTRATKVIVTVDNRSFKSFTFNESEQNVIETAPYANVTLIRPLSANNWNTICLPFDISQEQIAESFGAKTKVVKFDQVGADNTVKFVSATTIEAGVPYLIKPTTDAPTDGYKFYNVSITETESKVEGNDGEIQFVGLLAAKDITEGGRVTAAGVTSGGKIAMAKSGTTMKPFRAYFVFPSVQAVESCRIMVDGEETGIKIVTDDSSLSTTDTYTIGGQRVDGDNLDKGVYIRGGRKFVVRK